MTARYPDNHDAFVPEATGQVYNVTADDLEMLKILFGDRAGEMAELLRRLRPPLQYVQLRPTDCYHIGAGVAWAKRRPGDRHCCPATLPAAVFDRLAGGELLECDSGMTLRIYLTSAEAVLALRQASEVAP